MPAKKDFARLPNAPQGQGPMQNNETTTPKFTDINIQEQRQVQPAERNTVDSAVKAALDQQLKLGLRQSQEVYDEKMYQLRHIRMSDAEYVSAVDEVKNEARSVELELRQRAEQTLLAVKQMDQLAEDGVIPESTAVQAKYRLAGLPVPKTSVLDPVKEYKRLDSYRSSIERKLSKFRRQRIEKRPTMEGFPQIWMKKMSVPGEVTVAEKIFEPETGKYKNVVRKATFKEQQERAYLMQEMSRIRSKQIELMEASGHINGPTAQNLRTANRLQSAVNKKAVDYYERRAKSDPLSILEEGGK